jgi:fermentation-respiration switch protein FrsA (DUF1100 family)
MKGLRILILLLVIVALGAGGAFYYMGNQVFNGSLQMVDNQSTALQTGYDYLAAIRFDTAAFQQAYEIERIEIESSYDGHTIPADYITSGSRDADTVILVHGLGGNRVSVYPQAAMFLRNGYNVLTYDQRSSGENTAPYTTYGYWESKDLADCISFVDAQIGEDKKLIAWGVSFGGATVGIASGGETFNQKVDAAILDCPISNMRDMLEMRMAEMDTGIPVGFLLTAGDFATNMKLKFSYTDTEVMQYAAKTTVPMLVINSRADEVTPYYMGEDIYNALTVEQKELFTVEDISHGNIHLMAPAEYEQVVMNFIR